MDRFAAMEAFIRVVDAGSFSGAAKQLRIGQPAVSKTIAQLEDRLRVRLLLRSTHRLTPTEAGRNFYERAKRVIEEADEAELAARGAAATLSGLLRVYAPVTFTRLNVMPRLSMFLAEHPLLDIDVVLDDRDIDLIAAGIDVALLIGRLADSAATTRKIGQSRRRVIGTPAYFEGKGVPQTPVDLLAHEAIIYEQRDGRPTWAFRQGTSETTVNVSGRLRVSAMEGVWEGVLAGLGFAHRLRVGVCARAEVGCGHIRPGGLVATGCRSMGGVPDGPAGQCQGPGVCELYRKPNIGLAECGRAERFHEALQIRLPYHSVIMGEMPVRLIAVRNQYIAAVMNFLHRALDGG
jgi:DNA-binding transcriptional LysR family regulator